MRKRARFTVTEAACRLANTTLEHKGQKMKNGSQNRLASEVKVIPSWAFTLATVAFIAAQIFFNWMMAVQRHPVPLLGRIALGLLLGLVLAAYTLFLGYVNGDAQRRGMSRLLWTLVALLVPNGLGILLYFILRQPLHVVAASAGGCDCCPRCGYCFGPGCAQCHSPVDAADRFCRACGAELGRTTTAAV